MSGSRPILADRLPSGIGDTERTSEPPMRTRKFVLSPVFLVPALLIVTVGLVMAVAAFLIQDDNPRTEELYAARGDAPVEDVAPPSSGASEDTQTVSDQAMPAPE